jgi:hypothetical protein
VSPITIFFPDVSHYQAGLVIQPGTVVVIAKATEGTTFLDASYFDFKNQAANVGAIFVGYHYLHAGSTAAQAQYAFNRMGRTPAMLDVEAGSGGVSDILGFVDSYRALGGVMNLVYLPHWYWNQIGSPSLSGLASRGLKLVSSNYTTYSDSGPGWIGYGGCEVAQWQYSDNHLYGGQHVDFNAYKGTKDQYAALVGAAGTTTSDVLNLEELEMHHRLVNVGDEVTFMPSSVSAGKCIWVGLTIGGHGGLASTVNAQMYYDAAWHNLGTITVNDGPETLLPYIDQTNVRNVYVKLLSGPPVDVSAVPSQETI